MNESSIVLIDFLHSPCQSELRSLFSTHPSYVQKQSKSGAAVMNHNKVLSLLMMMMMMDDDALMVVDFVLLLVCYSGLVNRNLCFTLKMGLGTQKGV